MKVAEQCSSQDRAALKTELPSAQCPTQNSAARETITSDSALGLALRSGKERAKSAAQALQP